MQTLLKKPELFEVTVLAAVVLLLLAVVLAAVLVAHAKLVGPQGPQSTCWIKIVHVTKTHDKTTTTTIKAGCRV